MIFIWFIIPIMLMVLTSYYLYRIVLRGIKYFKKDIKLKKLKIISFILSLVIIAPVLNIYGIWIIVILHFACISLVIDFLHIIIKKIFRNKEILWLKHLYYSSALTVLIIAIILGYGYWNMYNIVRTDYKIETDKKISSEGYNIALISDLHFGTTIDINQLQKDVDKVEEKKPDIVILCGDIVDERTSIKEMQNAFNALGSIKSTYGTYFVYGNHDMQPYSNSPNFTVEMLKETIEQAGINILVDSNVVINNDIVLVGRADRAYGESSERSSAEELLKGVNTNKELILLDHQPSDYQEAEVLGYDVILSGHTHGGQIFPAGVISTIFNLGDLNYGYEKKGNLNAIVTSGITGWAYPIRTERHSEIVNIKLENAN